MNVFGAVEGRIDLAGSTTRASHVKYQTPREETIFKNGFGSMWQRDTLEDVGVWVAVTRECIRQIRSQGAAKLRIRHDQKFRVFDVFLAELISWCPTGARCPTIILFRAFLGESLRYHVHHERLSHVECLGIPDLPG